MVLAFVDIEPRNGTLLEFHVCAVALRSIRVPGATLPRPCEKNPLAHRGSERNEIHLLLRSLENGSLSSSQSLERVQPNRLRGVAA
jgi:hypothetical protein